MYVKTWGQGRERYHSNTLSGLSWVKSKQWLLDAMKHNKGLVKIHLIEPIREILNE